MTAEIETWKMRDGRVIKISDMDAGHLAATVKMLERKGFVPYEDFMFYMTCDGPTADGACECFEAEFNAMLEKKPSKEMGAMKKELERRGIK